MAAPKKLQLKDIPNKPEFKGRNVWKYTAGDDKEAFKAHFNDLTANNTKTGVMIHAEGYYSTAKKSPKSE